MLPTTMEVSKLLNTVEEFIKFVQSRAACITDTMKKLEDGVNLLKGQLAVHKSVIRANPPAHVLKQFPDIKHRLVTNLCSFIDEEINALVQAANQIHDLASQMETQFYKIERGMTSVDWSNNLPYYTAFSELCEWAGNCWKYLHSIYLNVTNGVRTFHNNDTHSDSWLNRSSTVDGITSNYIIRNRLIHSFDMLKKDLSSRSRTQVNTPRYQVDEI